MTMNALMLNKKMMAGAVTALKDHRAGALFFFVDAIEDRGFWRRSRDKKRFVLITQSEETLKTLEPLRKEVKAILKLPVVRLTRIGQVKLSLIMGVAEGIIKSSDKVVCVTGLPVHGILDSLMIIDLKKEAEVFTAMGISMDLFKKVKPEVLEAVLNIALELAYNEPVQGLSRRLEEYPRRGSARDDKGVFAPRRRVHHKRGRGRNGRGDPP